MPAERVAPHVVIVGGGFAGLTCARRLARCAVRVTLVDRRNHHVFQPLLYQVATAALSPANIAAPIRHILRSQRNASVLLAEATGVDLGRRVLLLSDGEIRFDALVLATGATHSYFGHPEWAKPAPGLKSIEDAVEIRRRFLLAFEAAEREADEAARRAKLTFVVVGGGPTGVEMAGSMIEIARRAIPEDFRSIDTTTARVILLQGGPRLLPAMPEPLGERARRDLEELGVEVRLNARVTHIDGDGVMVGEERIDAENIIWAAGVQASPLGLSLGAPVDRSGRVMVSPDLSVPGHPEILVVGDLAAIPLDPSKPDGPTVPGIAPAAIQMGAHAAHVIRADLAGRPRPAFRYRDKGVLATIGRSRAVGVIGRWRIAGVVAWLLWAGVHIFYLIGFRTKILVMLEWAWIYLLFDRGARLITGESRPELTRPTVG